MFRHLMPLCLAGIIAGCATTRAPQSTAVAKKETARQAYRLRGTVTELFTMPFVPISGLPPGYHLVDYEAMFSLGMRVVSIRPALAGFEKGRTVFFAIHSPTFIFFDVENPKGRTYDFVLQPPIPGEDIPEWGLKVRRPNQAMQPTASPRTASVSDD
jgi:hypothetical protein